MRVTELALREFESYRAEQRVPLEPHVTLLAGRNNVGKSALFRALALVTRSPLNPLPDFTERFRLTVTAEVETPALVAPAASAIHGDLQTRERHTLSGVLFPLAPGQRHVERIELKELAWVAEGPPGQRAGWTHGAHSGNAVGVDEVKAALMSVIDRFRYLAPGRVEQGRRSLRAQDELTPEARNLTDVIFRLQSANFRTMNRIVAFVRTSFPEIENVSVPPATDEQATPTGEPLVFYYGADDGVPLRSCGAGVEALLRYAVEILTPAKPRLFLIDEPQSHLHPHAERQLLRLIEDNPQHQYLIATHSHVLLNARPFSGTRLVSLVDGATVVTTPDERHQVFDEIGLTAADLGLAERVLWVEGPSEEAACNAILDADPSEAAREGVLVRRMPLGPSRFAAGTRRARAAYQMCSQIVDAVLPVRVDMRFLFDRDEKTAAEREAISKASGDRARFLPVRELENLFLRLELIMSLLSELAAAVSAPAPDPNDVAHRFAQLLADTTNRELFPEPPGADEDAVAVVRGSALLRELTRAFAAADYDKTEHGRRLTELALERCPEVLEPLRAELRAAEAQ